MSYFMQSYKIYLKDLQFYKIPLTFALPRREKFLVSSVG